MQVACIECVGIAKKVLLDAGVLMSGLKSLITQTTKKHKGPSLYS